MVGHWYYPDHFHGVLYKNKTPKRLWVYERGNTNKSMRILFAYSNVIYKASCVYIDLSKIGYIPKLIENTFE